MSSNQVATPDRAPAPSTAVSTLGAPKDYSCSVWSPLRAAKPKSPLVVVVLSAMRVVLSQVSSRFDSQPPKLSTYPRRIWGSSLKCAVRWKSRFPRVIVYTLTKCFGIISAQRICKHCQSVWVGAVTLGSSSVITVNWWTDMHPLLWKPELTLQTCQRLWMSQCNIRRGRIPNMHSYAYS